MRKLRTARLTTFVVATAGTLLTVGMAAPPASAATVACGDTVTTDVVLTNHLTCSGVGLTIAAPGVTVDLNGRRIAGPGSGVGIVVNGAGADATITGGRITGFELGVQTWGGPVRVEEMTFAGNSTGIRSHVGSVRVSGSTFRDNGTGLAHATGASVSDSAFRGNGTGIYCSDTGLQASGNRFTANGYGVDATLCGTTIAGNTFVGGQFGASLNPIGYGFTVSDNSFRGAVVGVKVTRALGGTRVITRNVFRGNGASGLFVDTEDMRPADPFQVTDNTFRDNGFAPAGHVDSAGTPLTSGLWANAGTLSGNRAVGNAGHGIEASVAFVDGGGNSARGNHTEPQCVGVVCSR